MGKQQRPDAERISSTNRAQVIEIGGPDPDFKIFTRGMEIEKSAASGDGKTRIKVIASSSIEDRHGDTITEEAIRGMAKQAVGLTIFRNHSYEVPQDVFGFVETAKARKMSASEAKDKGLIPDHVLTSADRTEVAFLELGLVVDDSNPLSNQTIASLENGVTLGISIGAMILEYEEKDVEGDYWMPPLIINKVDLLEASVVGIPANPLSWVEAATKAIAIQKGLVNERSTRSDLYKALERTKATVGEDGPETVAILREAEEPEPYEPEPLTAEDEEPKDEPGETPAEEGEETVAEAAIEPNHTQDDPAAIVNYYRHLIHDEPSDEEELVEPPTPAELKVLVRDALLAYKNAYPSDEEMDEVMDAIDNNQPLEAEIDPNADADSTEEPDADTDAQEAPEGSDPETAEGTEPEAAEKAAQAEIQKLVDAGALATLLDATGLLEQTFAQLVEAKAQSARLEAENADLRTRLLTADELNSDAVTFVNKVMDLPLLRKSAVRAEGTILSDRLLTTYGDILDLKGKGSS